VTIDTGMRVSDLPSDREPPPPDFIAGRYLVARRLGEGAFGVVYEAVDERIHKRVAVKVLRRGYAERSRYVDRFHQEAVAAAQLHHPNIVQVTDFASLDDGRPYLVMEYLEGDTLDKVLVERGRLAPMLAARIARDLCLGLAVAHRSGIVHRDLKPANVIVADLDGAAPRIKIVDFGIAKLTEEAEAATEVTTSAVLGTPTYMAPEQVRQRDPIDGRVDIYAVGIILYKLLTGSTPFAGRTAGDVMVSKVTEEAPSPLTVVPTLDPALVRIVRTAVRIEREQRYASADLMAAALSEVLSGAPVRRPLSERLRVESFPWPAVVGVVLAAVALIAIAAPRWGGSGRQPSQQVQPAPAPAPAPSPAPSPASSPALSPSPAPSPSPSPSPSPIPGLLPAAAVDAGVAPQPPRPARPAPRRERAITVDAGPDLLFGD
jgi:serine/threonine protein kinase